jgi:hypothetical protein
MQTRYRAAATALLLTATAGMAATGGAAEASGTHHSDAKAKSLTITIKSKTSGPKVSDDTFRPGNTTFRVKNIDGKASKGLIQILRLKGSYTFLDAQQDFQLAFPEDPHQAPDVDAINRIDKNIVFYGGMEAHGDKSKVEKWAVNIDKAGTYYVVNFDKQTLTTLTVKGQHQKRTLPSKDGFINPETGGPGGNKFVAGKHNPASGWMSTRNKAKEPHFVDIEQVKKKTKNSDLTAALTGQGNFNPFKKNGAHTDTGVISPGHRFLWRYHLKHGKYGVFCFWPSKTDGMPHALMGMHIVTKLH